MAGHAIFEILRAASPRPTRAAAIHAPPTVRGRIPVFVGDDVTDEDGLRAAAAQGGFGVKIGPEETCAAFRLPDTRAVHEWLSRLTAVQAEPVTLVTCRALTLSVGTAERDIRA